MTLELEQEESISILANLQVLQKLPIIKVEEIGNEKLVHRVYSVKTTKYPIEQLVIDYKVNKCTDKVKDYSVTLENDTDKVYLCKYSPKKYNTLFNNVILLELSNWRRVAQGLNPLKTIKDYTSLMFELDIDNKQKNSLLKKIYEKNSLYFVKHFQKFVNSNYIIPSKEWMKQLTPSE